MISDSLRWGLIVGVIIYFFVIIMMLKKKSLNLKYTLLWIFSVGIMLVLVIWPQLLNFFIKIVDIKTPVNALFTIFIFFILMILMSLTSIVSRQNERIKDLVQYNALLEKRIRELENESLRV